MNWDTACSNATIVEAFGDYKDLLHRIATLYAGSRLIESIDLSALGSNFALPISNNFSDGYTTIRTVGQLEDSISSGDYGQLALGLAVVQLCTAFEILFDQIADAYSISVNRTDSFCANHHLAVDGTMLLGNKALMQIRKIHSVKGIDSPLNSDEVLIKLAAIIEARNCIAHAGGVVTTQKAKDRLWAYKIPCTIGQRLMLKDNHLDDFLHFMTLSVMTFINSAP
jgi:hypothetical protein